MRNGIKYEKGEIKLDLAYLFEAMNEEDQKSFIHALSLEKNIVESVCDYLAGDDQNGCWSGYDDEWRLRALRRIEKEQLKGWSKYNWNFFREAEQRLKEIKEKQHIYWALNHGPFREPEMWDIWQKFCKSHNIVSEYTTKQADEDVVRVETIVRDALNKMSEQMDPDTKT